MSSDTDRMIELATRAVMEIDPAAPLSAELAAVVAAADHSYWTPELLRSASALIKDRYVIVLAWARQQHTCPRYREWVLTNPSSAAARRADAIRANHPLQPYTVPGPSTAPASRTELVRRWISDLRAELAEAVIIAWTMLALDAEGLTDA